MHKRYVLHHKQFYALEQAKKTHFSAYVGGIGSGKSTTGSHYSMNMVYDRPDQLGAIFSPTWTQLTQTTLAEFKEVLASKGIFQNVHYVINKNPKPIFGYDSKIPTNHNGIWSFCNGAQIYTFSLESFYRGATFGWLWLDEAQEADNEDITTITGRMRGADDPRIFLTMTPPRHNPDIDELIYGDSAIPSVFGTTYDNAENLSPIYLQGLEQRFDKITFAREVMCERITTDGLSWLYSFSRERNVNVAAKYQPGAMVYVSFDFNTNPIVCTLAHRGYYTKEYLATRTDLTDEQKKAKLGKRYVHYFDTVLLTPDKMQGKEHIQAIVDVIKEKTPYQWQHKAYIITGDATGRNSNVLARVGATAWSQVIDAFGISIQQVQTPKSNPTHVDARVLCNSFFANYDEVYISPHCKELIQDCEFVKAKPDGHKLKDSRKDETQRADLLDALTYDICTFNKDWIAIKR